MDKSELIEISESAYNAGFEVGVNSYDVYWDRRIEKEMSKVRHIMWQKVIGVFLMFLAAFIVYVAKEIMIPVILFGIGLGLIFTNEVLGKEFLIETVKMIRYDED